MSRRHFGASLRLRFDEITSRIGQRAHVTPSGLLHVRLQNAINRQSDHVNDAQLNARLILSRLNLLDIAIVSC